MHTKKYCVILIVLVCLVACVPKPGTHAKERHVAMSVFYGIGGAIEGRK
ncbi:hypothetical protein [Paraburkholderia phytofirmans]|nr:hypothetical protein [Paraburkholderia phytofirmans]